MRRARSTSPAALGGDLRDVLRCCKRPLDGDSPLYDAVTAPDSRMSVAPYFEARTEQPTFYIDFPTSVSPLTRPHRKKRDVAERWDLVAWGVELGTAYSELTDPVEQRRRLQEQSLLAAGGDPEAMELDEDFLQAMEYAMPPTGGLGMGVDRVVMLITGRSIRETLPFPLAKPR